MTLKTAGHRKPGMPDLIIDAGQGTLTVPRTPFNDIKGWGQLRAWKKSGGPALVIPLGHIRTATVRERTIKSGDGESQTRVVALTITEPGEASTREYDLGSWMLPNWAEAFAGWLRQTLGLPAVITGPSSASP